MKINFQSIYYTPILIGLLCIIGVLAFAQTFYYPFVHDDVVFIQQNPRIQDFNLKEIFISTQSGGSGKFVNTYYRPMLDVLYRVEYVFFKLNPFGYHAVNVFMHIGNAVLLLLLLQKILKSYLSSYIVALIFLIHPVQTEAVACIVGSSNLLFAFFLLLSLFYYLKQNENVLHYISSLIFFLLALFTKEQAVILPAILIGYECRNGVKSNFQEKLKAVSGHIVILCFYMLVRKMNFGHTGVDLGNIEEFKLRLLSIPATLLMYFKILIYPEGLHYYRSTDILLPYIIPTIVLVSLGILLFFSLRMLERKNKILIVGGLGWFIITLLPTLNILPLVNEYSFILTSEHFLYLPLIGIVVAAVGYVRHFQKKIVWLNNKYLVGGVIVILILGYFLLTQRQNTYWRSELALFERMMKYENNFARGHLLLARAYYYDNQLESSVKHYEMALKRMNYYADQVSNEELKNFYLGFIREICFEAAHVYQKLGNKEKTIFYYKKLIELDPHFSKAYINLGAFYASQGDLEKAQENFNRAADMDPYEPTVWQNLYTLYTQIGDHEGVRKATEMMKRSLDRRR